MKGDTPISIPVPVKGLVRNVPIHEAPADSLVDGLNVFVDEDGLLKTRRGYQEVGPNLSATDRILGIIGYRDENGDFVQVVASQSTWWKYNGDGTFTDLTAALSGSIEDPVEFVAFFQSGKVNVLGVNNANGLTHWDSSLGSAASVTTPFTTARDICVLANRVVVVNLTESGTKSAQRVRWSGFNDYTSWPALAVNDLLDEDDEIVAIKRTSRLSAIVYRDRSAWLLSAYPGNDANAFTAERLYTADNIVGPVSPAAVAIAEGVHYYLGQDGRIYVFDGNTIYTISAQVDPVIRNLLNTETANRACATYLPAKRMVVFFFPGGGDDDPAYALAYSLTRGCFEPLWHFPDFITACAIVQETNSLTWNNWVDVLTTWDTVPFASWDSIPFSKTLDVWVGTTGALIERFFIASQDDGVAIPYEAVWPPHRAHPSKKQRVQFIELYLVQANDPEAMGFNVWSLPQPFWTPHIPIASLAVALDIETTYNTPIQPGPDNARNIAANFIQWRIKSSGSQAEFAFGGGTIFTDLDDRGDYGLD